MEVKDRKSTKREDKSLSHILYADYLPSVSVASTLLLPALTMNLSQTLCSGTSKKPAPMITEALRGHLTQIITIWQYRDPYFNKS